MKYPCGLCTGPEDGLGEPTIATDPEGCPTIVHETVCVQAGVTLRPAVRVGEVQSFCAGDPAIGVCSETPSRSCSFTIRQSLCVQVPLVFAAAASAEPSGIVCGTPFPGPCPVETACTHTIGYFKNHPGVTNFLIGSAGGFIVLGIDEEGSSFTVNTTNADAVLSLHTPAPPAPLSPPYAGQYQNLYAQLLAANLNLLTGATCEFAIEAIEAANAFLAASPYGEGMDGAPAVQTPLAQFNEGTAPDCPAHCP